MIELALTAKGKNKTTFYHFEQKFLKRGQTVVIWCFRDFCNNKKWSEEAFAVFERQDRVKNLLKRKSMSIETTVKKRKRKQKTEEVEIHLKHINGAPTSENGSSSNGASNGSPHKGFRSRKPGAKNSKAQEIKLKPIKKVYQKFQIPTNAKIRYNKVKKMFEERMKH